MAKVGFGPRLFSDWYIPSSMIIGQSDFEVMEGNKSVELHITDILEIFSTSRVEIK